MARKVVAGGVVVEYPDDLRLVVNDGDATGRLRAAPQNVFGGVDSLLKAVADSPEFTTVAELEFTGGIEKTRLAKLADVTTAEEVTVQVPLADDEQAVLLNNSDGVLRWEFPYFIEAGTGPRASGGLGPQPGQSQRFAMFKSRYQPVVDLEKSPDDLGFVGDFLLRPVKKLVLRFVARRAGESVSHYLERNIQEALVVIARDEAANIAWQPCGSFKNACRPDGEKRVLLFVHGTFSSTVGSFVGSPGTELEFAL